MIFDKTLQNLSTKRYEEGSKEGDKYFNIPVLDRTRGVSHFYLFQVLTLDRGTTSGLLIHNQNDVGIMGSLSLYINKVLLSSQNHIKV